MRLPGVRGPPCSLELRYETHLCVDVPMVLNAALFPLTSIAVIAMHSLTVMDDRFLPRTKAIGLALSYTECSNGCACELAPSPWQLHLLVRCAKQMTRIPFRRGRESSMCVIGAL